MSSAARRAIFLNEMGVGPLWTRRDAPAAAAALAPVQPAELHPASAAKLLPPAVTVLGVGDENANWLFIGEGPGYNEDLQGEPFVGDAEKLLDNMLVAMSLKRGENTYIANIVKHHPTDADGRDRSPSAEEIAACLPYLQRQIELIQPSIIVALGKTAALSLLNLDPETPISKLRGTVHRYRELPLVVTYHPAYLLRNLADKKKAWADLRLAMTTYAGNS
jgi:DNA polymerase